MADVDPFELRLKLSKYLQAASNPQSLKSAQALCCRYVGNADELFQCILDAMSEDFKNRRPILSLLEVIYEVKEYQVRIKNHFTEIVKICLDGDKTTSQSWIKNAAKGLKSLLRLINLNETEAFSDLNVTINEAMGMSEAEQKNQKLRQQVMEEIEKEREKHKLLREACWSIKDDSSFDLEFLSFLRLACKVGERQYQQSSVNSRHFEKLNPIEKKPPAKRKQSNVIANRVIEKPTKDRKILVLKLEEIILDVVRLSSNRDKNIRQLAVRLNQVIKEIAKRCYFYSDLREFDTPHLHYYSSDDDHRDLRNYSFHNDDLSLYLSGSLNPSEVKFYRERTFRNSVAAERFGNINEIQKLIPVELEKESRGLLKDLSHALNMNWTRMFTSIERCLKDPQYVVCVVSDQHMCLALATLTVLGLNSILPEHWIYSTTKFDFDWVLSQVKLNYQTLHKMYVLGNSILTEKSAEKIGGKIITILEEEDLSAFTQDLIDGKI